MQAEEGQEACLHGQRAARHRLAAAQQLQPVEARCGGCVAALIAASFAVGRHRHRHLAGRALQGHLQGQLLRQVHACTPGLARHQDSACMHAACARKQTSVQHCVCTHCRASSPSDRKVTPTVDAVVRQASNSSHLLPYASLASTQHAAATFATARRPPSPVTVQCLSEGCAGSTCSG